MERADEIKAAQPFVTQYRKTGIWSRQILQWLSAQEQGSGRHSAAGAGERGAEMMACKQPGPGPAADWLTEHCDPVVCRSHALDGVASSPRPWRIVLQVFQFLGPQKVVMAHDS